MTKNKIEITEVEYCLYYKKLGKWRIWDAHDNLKTALETYQEVKRKINSHDSRIAGVKLQKSTKVTEVLEYYEVS